MEVDNLGITELKTGDFDGLTGISVLDLAPNQLSTLPDGIFKDLKSVVEIVLSSNQLTTLPTNIFRGLDSLARINLVNNQFETLPEGLFAGHDLSHLFLGDNPFTELPSGAFKDARIQIIDFSPGYLTSIPADTLQPLGHSLSALYLDNNDLTELPHGIFAGTQLGELALSGNPGTPFQIEVGIQSEGDGKFQIAVPIGAPSPFEVPVTVTNGTIDGTTTKTIRVPYGTVATEPVVVTRSGDSASPITATLGTIAWTVPMDHGGYAYSRATTTTVEVAPQAAVPGAPTDLTAHPDGTNEIELAWTAPEDDVTAPITSYRIEISTDGETWTDAVTNTASTDTTYMHAGRVAGTTYYYRVSAVNVAGAGAASNVASAMTTALTGVCERSPSVVIEIERATATDCTLVTANQLATITGIDLGTHAPSALALRRLRRHVRAHHAHARVRPERRARRSARGPHLAHHRSAQAAGRSRRYRASCSPGAAP